MKFKAEVKSAGPRWKFNGRGEGWKFKVEGKGGTPLVEERPFRAALARSPIFWALAPVAAGPASSLPLPTNRDTPPPVPPIAPEPDSSEYIRDDVRNRGNPARDDS